MTKPIIWNYGGGIQSVAIGILIASGKLPMPERAVIADTGRENGMTFRYMREIMQPLLNSVGLTIEIASHRLAKVDLYREGDTLPLIPAYTKRGALSLFCSGEWKRAVVNRWLTEPERGFGRDNPVIQWIGYSREEKKRYKNKKSPLKWIQFQFPLIQLLPLPLSKAECEIVIKEAGLPLPFSSSCWCCPFKSNKEWRELQESEPKQFIQACNLDEEIRERDDQNALYLHRDRVPLVDVDLTEKEKPLSVFYQNECVEGCYT